jgi:hypothetical protein
MRLLFFGIALAAMAIPVENSGSISSVTEVTIDNEQEIPITVEGRSRNDRLALHNPPVTYTLTPVDAGVMEANYFVPNDGWVGTATVLAEATNRKGDPISGTLSIIVLDAPATRLEVIPGIPVDK